VQSGLQQEGYAVDVMNEGAGAGERALSIDYDAVILDLMLPGQSGLQVLREIRGRKPQLPVMVLTAKDSLEERVAGLDAGADDYMVKPFALAELAARLRALLRRGVPQQNVLRVADLQMDTVRRTVRRADRVIELKPKEYALLEFLMRHSGRPLTKSLIIEHVWDIHFDSVSNVVEVHINSLRNKIDRGFDAPLIQTVRGVGYLLGPPSEQVDAPRKIVIHAMAPEKFPEVRAVGTTATFTLSSCGAACTHVRLVQTGWKEGKEWDDAYEYLAGGNAQLLEMLYRRSPVRRSGSSSLPVVPLAG